MDDGHRCTAGEVTGTNKWADIPGHVARQRWTDIKKCLNIGIMFANTGMPVALAPVTLSI